MSVMSWMVGRGGRRGSLYIPLGWVGCIYSLLSRYAPPAPGIHPTVPCTAPARCHRHGGDGVCPDNRLGSSLEGSHGWRASQYLLVYILLWLMGELCLDHSGLYARTMQRSDSDRRTPGKTPLNTAGCAEWSLFFTPGLWPEP